MQLRGRSLASLCKALSLTRRTTKEHIKKNLLPLLSHDM